VQTLSSGTKGVLSVVRLAESDDCPASAGPDVGAV
jgi:hypothetical protein